MVPPLYTKDFFQSLGWYSLTYTSTRKRGILKLFQVMGFLQVGSVLQKVPQRRQEHQRRIVILKPFC